MRAAGGKDENARPLAHQPIDHALLKFLESAYQAGARTAGWDIEEYQTNPVY